MIRLAVLVGALSACRPEAAGVASRPSLAPATVAPSPELACQTPRCRWNRYTSAFRAGEHVTLPGARGSIVSRPGCPAVHWRRVSLNGTSGNAFNQSSQLLLLGRRAGVVSEVARLAESTSTIDGAVGDDAAWQGPSTGDVALITLHSALSGMPAYGSVNAEQRPEPDPLELCTLVHLDSCTGRVGYVCSGFEVEKRFEGAPLPPGGQYVLELELERGPGAPEHLLEPP